jgi:hypothetical protein
MRNSSIALIFGRLSISAHAKDERPEHALPRHELQKDSSEVNGNLGERRAVCSVPAELQHHENVLALESIRYSPFANSECFQAPDFKPSRATKPTPPSELSPLPPHLRA